MFPDTILSLFNIKPFLFKVNDNEAYNSLYLQYGECLLHSKHLVLFARMLIKAVDRG